MRRILILLLHCLFAVHMLQGQTTFSTTIDFSGGAESGVAVLPLEDGFIIAGGGWGYEFPNFFDEKIKFAKTDLEGNVIWQNVLGDSAVKYFTDWSSILQTVDGNVVFSVTKQTDTTSFPMLVKINPDTGDTIFTKYYNHDSLVNSTFLRELSDGSLILLVYDPFDLFGSILIKTTAEGGGYLGETVWHCY